MGPTKGAIRDKVKNKKAIPHLLENYLERLEVTPEF